jgi:hypothetical protein
MIRIRGQYERDEVWDSFTSKSHHKQWPPASNRDEPFSTFTCKICRKKFTLQDVGHYFVSELPFDDRILIILSEHMNIKHPRETINPVMKGEA